MCNVGTLERTLNKVREEPRTRDGRQNYNFCYPRWILLSPTSTNSLHRQEAHSIRARCRSKWLFGYVFNSLLCKWHPLTSRA